MHHEFRCVSDLIHYSQTGASRLGKGVYFVGNVAQPLAVEIMRATGLQVIDYRVAIDHSAIIHALRKHGQPTEVLQGQLPVSLADITGLADWLLHPTRVADAGQKPRQPRCLRFELETPTALVVAILEIRPNRNRRQLALKTCYKKRPTA